MDDADRVQDFVRASWPRLLGTARMLTGDPHEAEDLTQATLVKVVAAWPRIQRRDDPTVYARRVMINLATSRWRRRRRTHYQDLLRREGLAEHAPDHAGGISDRDAVWRVMATLPARMRAVLVLRYYEDLTEAETAEILECSVGTVKSQASRGLARLRQTTVRADLTRRAEGPTASGEGDADPGPAAGAMTANRMRGNR